MPLAMGRSDIYLDQAELDGEDVYYNGIGVSFS
jgi:hypothetical protein